MVLYFTIGFMVGVIISVFCGIVSITWGCKTASQNLQKEIERCYQTQKKLDKMKVE